MASQIRLRAARVLVVDDEPMLAAVTGRLLELRGLRVDVFRSFGEALATTKAYAVGVFDIELGDGSGVDLAQYMLDTGQVGSVVFFTGGAAPEQLERAHQLGEVHTKGSSPLGVIDAVCAIVALPQVAAG